MALVILGAIVAGGIIDGFRGAEKSIKFDERARKKFARAYEKQAEANALINKKNKQADIALKKVINRKRGILLTSMKDFLSVYEKVMKINFKDSQGISELNKNLMTFDNIKSIKTMTEISVRPMNTLELVSTFLGSGGGVGLGHAMVEDSKRNLSVANKQLKAAEIVYLQAENLSKIIDILIERSENISTILAKLNRLFIKSINFTNNIISNNGFDRENYTLDDRKALMTCMNIAYTIKKIIDTPLIDKEGELAKETLNAIEIGNKFLSEMEELV